jgi:alpha-D-ribose 1-methylphosphonate 5-triphosphate synthase subunit PhnH
MTEAISQGAAFAATSPGFAAPGRDAQAVFRAALTALSEPGRVIDLPVALDTGLPVGSAALALLVALADGDTPLWLDPRASDAAGFFGFHTGAPVVAAPQAARFALIAEAAGCPPLHRFALGEEEYPDRSATLVIEVTSLEEGGPLILSGPGIADRRQLSLGGLAPSFLVDWAANHAAFPRGVDIFFTCGTRLCGLPRSIRLEGRCM